MKIWSSHQMMMEMQPDLNEYGLHNSSEDAGPMVLGVKEFHVRMALLEGHKEHGELGLWRSARQH